MRRVLVALSAVAVLLLPLATPTAAGADPAGDEARLLQLLNVSRAAAGLPLLPLDGGLSNVARGWSAVMASNGGISHNQNLANSLSSIAWTSISPVPLSPTPSFWLTLPSR